MKANERIVPPDQDQRDVILHDLDSTILVEAAAGTGKTTSMVGRMVNLLAAGKCSIDTLAAVTFTRKAAAELRARFQVGLERAHHEASAAERHFLSKALDGIERCFIGTIHSFCARMLRERPVEAGVDLDFKEIDEIEDATLRSRAWYDYVAGLYASAHPILGELEDLGVEIGQLWRTFTKLADYPDVEEWPAARVPLPDTTLARQALADLVDHMERLAPELPEDPGNDKLIPTYRLIPLMFRQALREDRLFEFMEVLARFQKIVPVKKNWPGGPKQADAEAALWDDFRTTYAEPLVRQWREHRYEPLLRALLPGIEVYERLKRTSGKLNYQDLLMKAASLLREGSGGGVREYFRRRFTHLLVDEFQDTDPVQAEVIMLLTAENLDETDWRKCRPIPGSLFVVGDPKQSIYRFRRADIVTYNQVKEIIQRHGGKVANLSTNFRTTRPLVEWVNGTFDAEFGRFPIECSPEYVPLAAIREDDVGSELSGIRSIRVSKKFGKNEEIVEYEADLIVRAIRHAIDNGLRVPKPLSDIDGDSTRPVEAGDFLIVTRNKENLAAYSRTLQDMGVPHQVTGGKALNQLRELKLLHTLLVALTRPDNPVALVAVLRGELFGISDPDLFAFRRAGGRFSFHAPIPASLDDSTAAAFAGAFERLHQYALWLVTSPPVAAIERIVDDLGLAVRAAASPGGNVQAGSFAKALELLRSAQVDFWSVADLVDYLGRLVQEDEAHDAMPALAEDTSVVRVMNLHKVKGLEAPFVFLADPTGKSKHPAQLYVDRTGDKVRGCLAIEGTEAGITRRVVLAQPPQWEALSNKEEQFQEAEELRLLYVAATRAGCGLTVTLRESYKNRSPWTFFEKNLKKSLTLGEAKPSLVPAAEAEPIDEQEPSDAAEAIQRQWAEAYRRSYDVVSVKALTVQKGKFILSHGEHGTEWGSVIHLLLEAVMLDPAADVRGLAEAALADRGLNTDLTEDAVLTVDSMVRSEIWTRARAAQHRLVEVPFQRRIPAEGDGNGRPTIMRGVIDLAFKEADGWVIVDYKSDRVPEGHIDHLVDQYAPQVVSYGDAWAEMTGETVRETGLYFTHMHQYVRVGRSER